MDSLDDIKQELRDIKTNIQTIQITAARTEQQVYQLKESVETMRESYVTKEAFDPVRLIVYGIIGVLGTGLLVGILGMLITATPH